jgi:hypothetical protein
MLYVVHHAMFTIMETEGNHRSACWLDVRGCIGDNNLPPLSILS